MVRRIAVGIFALTVLAIVFGLIYLGEEAPPEPDLKLLVLSPHWLGIKEEFSRGFRDYYRKRTSLIAEVEWLDQGGTSSIRRYIENKFSGSPEGIGVDLFFGGGIAPYLRLSEKGYFEAYRPPKHVLSGIPKDLAGIPVYDAKHRWFGACFSGFGIVYNKAVGSRMKLPEVSVRRPVMTMMFFLALYILGVMSFYLLPIDVMPDLEVPSITVITQYPGAGA